MKASVRELDVRHGQDEAARLSALLDRARDHAAAFRNREGLAAAREALNLARRCGDSLAVGRALGTATLCHYQRTDYVSAIATGLDAVAACAQGDLAGRSRALQSIALALFSIGARDPAQAVAAQAVTDARTAGDAEREALARSVLGITLAERGDFEGARRQFRCAASHYRDLADVIRLKKSTSNLGHAYRRQANAEADAGRPTQARLYWDQALRVYRIAYAAARHDADDAIILGAVAECECRLGRLDAAYADARHGLELARRVNSGAILANCLLWEGNILQQMGELEEARLAYERACEAAGGLEHQKVLTESLHALAALLYRQGHDERAAQVQERALKSAVERDEFLARVRAELGPLWNRLLDFHA